MKKGPTFSVYLHILCITILYISHFQSYCSAQCPSPGNDPVVEYIGRGLKLSDVVACTAANRGKTLINVHSFDNITVDINFQNVGGGDVQPSLLIVAPTLIVSGARNFDLSGAAGQGPPSKPSGKGSTKGVPGVSGKTGGSVVVAYREGNGGTLNFIVDGGAGGNGQDGQDAPDGANGAHRPVRQYNDDDCSAWSGGWVKVWLTPNRCYERMDGDGRCHADDSGARIDVYGTNGQPGSNGNDGGAAGIGGNGGIGVEAIVSEERNSTVIGNKGREGMKGVAGSLGSGGKKGDTNALTIDDAAGSSGKRCKILGQSYVSVNEFAADGRPGTNGGNCCAVSPLPPFTLADFAPHIQSYVNKCMDEGLASEDMVLLRFCNNVKNHFNL